MKELAAVLSNEYYARSESDAGQKGVELIFVYSEPKYEFIDDREHEGGIGRKRKLGDFRVALPASELPKVIASLQGIYESLATWDVQEGSESDA